MALPFNRGVILWGEPIFIPKDMADEEARLLVETAMNDLSAKADQMMGHAPIDPAPEVP